ncbi:unnamed protein product [Peronospora effusa]|uniref:Peptidase S1 domain-containing protein n=1 Tax=Peronospora effusa TaxID=542832 RepID=A0A3M6V9Z4_9STRA|nr:hypothetical protein DD238_007531 [Peronospora effusa]RQM16200.1 hypothetical protein DD237_006787 [Peronospora effusa]CAI5708698.1 unnamed protein product [Peronospora effusa]
MQHLDIHDTSDFELRPREIIEMKFASAFVVTFAALVLATLRADAYANTVERKLILGGTTVPKGRKSYYTGVRNTAEGNNLCGGVLVSPIHVLTVSQCITYDIRWVSVGSHFNNGTEDGEQIKVVSVMIHPNFTDPLKFSNDFAILELEVASSFKPAKLAKADDSDFDVGATVITVGTGRTSEGPSAPVSHELRRVDSNLITNDECQVDGKIVLDKSMMCVEGQISKGYCTGDNGDPVFIEYSDNDADDVVVGIASWRKSRGGDVCGIGISLPIVYSRVSYARYWIDPIIKTSCFV